MGTREGPGRVVECMSVVCEAATEPNTVQL
jgi:hypothetical protein